MHTDNASNPQQAVQDQWAIPSPDWDQWKSVKQTQLWKAVALLCNIDPPALQSTFDPNKLDTIFNRAPDEFYSLLALAKNNLGPDSLKPVSLNTGNLEESEVALSTFTTWANSNRIDLPALFPWQPEMTTAISGWPWGRYDTKLLKNLALAADRFWKNYDPSDHTTAPTNQEVSNWLTSQGVTARIAAAMATILRADGLPPGPRT